MLWKILILFGQKRIVERISYPHTDKQLIFNRYMLHKSLFQREVTSK